MFIKVKIKTDIMGVRERTVHWGEFSPHHYYKQNFPRKNVTEFRMVSDCVFYLLLYYIITQLLTIVFT